MVILILAAALYISRSTPSAVPETRTAHRQMTFLGDAYEPAISPDGMFVAYVTRKSGEDQKLIMQDLNGSTLELAHAELIWFPRWSPDGSELIFPKRNLPNATEIDLISRLGGVARRVSDVGGFVCWSPDGTHIVTGFRARKGFDGLISVDKLTGQVEHIALPEYTWLLDLESSPKTGLLLVLLQVREKYQIWTLKPDGTQQRKVLEENNEMDSPRWSPVGDAIYYVRRKESTTELVRFSEAGKHPGLSILASGLQVGDLFTVSADGSRLAYTRVNRSSNLWRVHLPTGGKAKPEISQLTFGTSYYGEPSFSPDGRWLTFPLGSSDKETNIYKMEISGGRPTQLTFFEHAIAASPAWSPDGQRIAFLSNQKGRTKVWTINVNGGAAEALEETNSADTSLELAWAPSRDIMYLKPGNRNYIRVNSQTQAETLLIRDDSVGWVGDKPTFSPDGTRVATSWNRGKDVGLWLISTEPYSETLLQGGGAEAVGWAPDGKYVYAVREREIIKIGIANPKQVASVVSLSSDVNEGNYATISPNGRDIVVCLSEEKSDVWLMENFDPYAGRTRD